MPPRSRFLRPDTKTLQISNGDTLVVKRRLTNGENREMYARFYIANVDGKYKVNPLQTGIAKVVAYLVDWSLVDDAGAKVKIEGLSADALTAVLDALDPDDFAEIMEAVNKHEAEMDAERALEKNGQGGGNGSSAISPLPIASAGDTSGSASSIQTSTT